MAAIQFHLIVLVTIVWAEFIAQSSPAVPATNTGADMIAPLLDTRPNLPIRWKSLSPFCSSRILTSNEIQTFYPTLKNKSDAVFSISNGEILTRTLGLSLSPNTTYNLTVGVGSRTSADFGGFDVKIDTLSGVVVGEWQGFGNNFTPPGQIGDFSRTFTTGFEPAGNGEQLRMTITRPNSAANSYTDLQNIRLIASPAAIPYAVCQPIDVFLVAGQSNAHGYLSDASKLSSQNRHYADTPNPQALLAYYVNSNNKGTFCTLCPQGPGFGGKFVGFGPELSLGADIADAFRKPIAIMKYSQDGSGLNKTFKKSVNIFYPSIISCVRLSLQQLRERGFDPTLKAFFWLQGETDVGDHPEMYGRNIADFVHDICKDLNTPGLKFFLTEINIHAPAFADKSRELSEVNQGMRDLAHKDPLVNFIRTDDIVGPFDDGWVHYNADQEISIGQRWAEAYQLSLSKQGSL